ncbi:penicillin-binding protein 1C [Dethiosulfovibrio peptidovorans DSM 11002]|uniref:peptidoglycan glycosyltransferase n=1 Tax=Dethiosulfovibrio peptidovorans DSM 11002 TaxID=469381 RepID=D2Z6U8_9BACT|nr:penicillin-binding protein 1C [Dethiosulfovibrio peptidovorans]EFC91195.1 penicillin-binding protein 1C [Dethiosulfovibrio peptidovorans DSM 11002]
MKRKYLLCAIPGLPLAAALAVWIASFSVSPVTVREVASLDRSPRVADRDGEVLWVGLTSEDKLCLPLSLDEMGRWLPLVLIEVEDRRFRKHHGVDWLGLVRAAVQNVRSGGIVSGGSTITSQLIRMARPRERTFSAKAREFLQAIDLERRLSKDGILEMYLNRAPFGGVLQGAGAASLGWWGKSPKDLSLAEAAVLVAMLKGPTRYRPDLHPERLRTRRDRILRDLGKRGVVSEEAVILAMEEPLPGNISIPDRDFLFVSKVLEESPEGGRSTLDRKVQLLLEEAISSALRGMSRKVTAAAALVDNRDGSVRGYVGNGRFDQDRSWSWVDCCDSPRSPGSTLKPFVYAMAFEGGQLSPSSLMADTPLSLSGRAPRNFDLRYRGPVSASDALADSLNVPAVRVLRSVGAERFLHRLRTLGFSLLREDGDHYGDSLILGGCEVTLLELLRAFSTLATCRSRPLSFLEGTGGARWEDCPFSDESSFLVGEILRDSDRLSPYLRSLLSGKAEIAFKTGTSYGFRDAWAVAWNESWTLAVWFGDPEGTPHPELVGLSASVPVVVEVMSRLGGTMPLPPAGVSRRTVCSLSGLPLNSACPSGEEAWYIPGVSPESPCDMHRWTGGKSVTVLPPELAAWGRARETSLTIVSPLDGAEYLMPPLGEPPRIPLSCEGASGKVSWFVDGLHLGTVPEGRRLFWSISEGRHRISAVDEKGRSDRAVVKVTPWGR